MTRNPQNSLRRSSLLVLAGWAFGFGCGDSQPAGSAASVEPPTPVTRPPPAAQLSFRAGMGVPRELPLQPFEVFEREWSAVDRSFSILRDGLLDLRLVGDEPASLELQALRPGHLTPLGRVVPGSPDHMRLQLVPAGQLMGLVMGEIRGAPVPLSQRVPLKVDHQIAARIIRPRLGGGGAVAVVTLLAAQFDETGELRGRLSVAVSRLGPGVGLVPRLAPGLYGSHGSEQLFRLYSEARFHHPSYCTLDVITLDRDHLEWSGTSAPSLVHHDRGTLKVVSSAVSMWAGTGGQLLWPAPGPEVSTWSPKVSPFCLVHERRSGFDRLLSIEVVRRDIAFAELRTRDLKAHDLLLVDGSPAAKACAIVVLDQGYEPVAGAFVSVLEDSGRSPEVPVALWSAASDHEGLASVPISLNLDPGAANVLAFRTGAEPLVGRRQGAALEPGRGGEVVVVATPSPVTVVKTTPVPGREVAATLAVAGVCVRVRIGADGELRLPALGGPARLELDPPWWPSSVDLVLDEGVVEVSWQERIHPRRWLLDRDDGSPITTPEVEIRGQGVRYEMGSLVVEPEFADREVTVTVHAEGFRPAEFTLKPQSAEALEADLFLEHE